MRWIHVSRGLRWTIPSGMTCPQRPHDRSGHFSGIHQASTMYFFRNFLMGVALVIIQLLIDGFSMIFHETIHLMGDPPYFYGLAEAATSPSACSYRLSWSRVRWNYAPYECRRRPAGWDRLENLEEISKKLQFFIKQSKETSGFLIVTSPVGLFILVFIHVVWT